MKIHKEKSAAATPPGDLRYVPLETLLDHKEIENREIDKEHVDDLFDSILRNGQDTPFLCWDGGNPENIVNVSIAGEKTKVPANFLIGGFHRRVAVRRILKEDAKKFASIYPNGVPVHVVHGDLVDALAAQLRENIDRLNPTTAEVLPFIERLVEQGLKQKQIAKRIGKSASYVNQVLAIAEHLGEEGTKKLKHEGASLSDSTKAAKKVKKGQATREEALEEVSTKTKKKKSKNRQRAEKRHSLAKCIQKYDALPNLAIGKRLAVLDAIVRYALGTSDDLPDEIDFTEAASDKKKKKAK